MTTLTSLIEERETILCDIAELNSLTRDARRGLQNVERHMKEVIIESDLLELVKIDYSKLNRPEKQKK